MKNLEQPIGPEVTLSTKALGLKTGTSSRETRPPLGDLVSKHSRSIALRVIASIVGLMIVIPCLLLFRETNVTAWIFGAVLGFASTAFAFWVESRRFLLLYEKGLCLRAPFRPDREVLWADLTYLMVSIHNFVVVGSLDLYSETSGKMTIDMSWKGNQTVQNFALWLASSAPEAPPEEVPADSFGYRVGRWLAGVLGRTS